jgi:hypothetical protein
MSPQPRTNTTSPTWAEIALYLRRQRHRLDPMHHEFVDDMVGLIFSCKPSRKQREYLRALFRILGGKIE